MPNPKFPNVSSLIAQARHGDAGCRDQLFVLCRSYLEIVARAQVETWLRAKVDASDIVQQSLLEAHRGFERFTGETAGEWLAWLKRIVVHNAWLCGERWRLGGRSSRRRAVVPAWHAPFRASGSPG